jgi:thiamine biosynthesis protein ThiC
VTWKKVSDATGYQIQYARNGKFTKSLKTINIKKNTTTSKKIAKLTRGKKYYVRVRAYRKTSKATYYGAWSRTKSVKCK